MSDGSSGSQDDRLTALLGEVWNAVILHVNKLCEAHSKYGTVKFHLGLNPSLQEIIEGFEFVDKALTILIDTKKLTYEEKRDALNSKQCILKMNELYAACHNSLTDDIERIIKELNEQSKF